jgi:hypothetical protein
MISPRNIGCPLHDVAPEFGTRQGPGGPPDAQEQSGTSMTDAPTSSSGWQVWPFPARCNPRVTLTVTTAAV